MGALRRGIGVASGWWHGVGRAGSQAQVIAYRDGRVELRTGSQDIGTGTRTILAMIAAEELGIPLTQLRVEIGDTRYPYAVPSGGSSTAPSTTPAVRQAAAHLKGKLLRLAAPALGAEAEDLRHATVRSGYALTYRVPYLSLTYAAEFPLIRFPLTVNMFLTMRAFARTKRAASSPRSKSIRKLELFECSKLLRFMMPV